MIKAKTSGGNLNTYAIIGLVFLAVAYVGYDLGSKHMQQVVQAAADAKERERSDAVVGQLVTSEELILKLTPKLRLLSRSVRNLHLPDTNASTLYADTTNLRGQLQTNEGSDESTAGALRRGWRVTPKKQTVSRGQLKLWSPLFAETAFFERAKFYFIRGEFADANLDRFRSKVGFDGYTVYRDGRQASLHADLDIEWHCLGDNEWQISTWQLNDWRSLETNDKLFVNVIDAALADPKLLSRATESRHYEITSSLIRGQDYFLPPGVTYPYFFPDVTLEHPGLAVVDINADGFDDLYVAMQHGSNLLFLNRGDGTFDEVASQYGLDIDGDSTSAIFADFDNDSDLDLFLGRGRHRAMYLVNEDGKFTDQSTQLIDCDLPALVSSISSADYNGDGLLDIYLCTYSPIEPGDIRGTKTPAWISHFLSRDQETEYKRLSTKSHPFLSRIGPPNVLLKNSGDGTFELAEINEQTELWRMSFQASWSDVDGDLDPDLYVANDYGPDAILRNDGADGFVEITDELGLTGMGFGMGVSWGDYNNDGEIDIYVSNMYSKAGQRITSEVAGIDPRIQEMAGGNFLYRRNKRQTYDLVSGLEASHLKVAKAGWSWGGQFLDFNNDGFRDIYVVNGYYTAPPDVAEDVDL